MKPASTIDYNECLALRGIAIIGIFFHNFCHWITEAYQENEFGFLEENNTLFWESVVGPDFLIHIFSFWGHLGVPVFVFLSGYGLSLKYESLSISCHDFLYSQYKKLFVPLLIGTFIYVIVICIGNGSWDKPIHNLLLQVLMLLNIFPHPGQNISPVPYWYFGFTMQLYILYRLMVYKRSTLYLLLLTIICGVCMALTESHPTILEYMKYNFMGWLLPFLMGVLVARHPMKPHFICKRGPWLLVGIVATLTTIFFSLFFQLWLIMPALVVLCAISLVKVIPAYIQVLLNYVGRYTMFIFTIHPITRAIIFPQIYSKGIYTSLLIYTLATLLLVCMTVMAQSFIKQQYQRRKRATRGK